MKRITWLDTSRGLAIILLIVMHYVGALESRQMITKDVLHIIYGLLRMATPFFMFSFGLAFYITASKKIARSNILEYYRANVIKRLLYILIGREIIVIILAFRYPEMADEFWSILFFQEFSKGGEILLFYLFAFLIAPLNVWFLHRVNKTIYIVTWLGIYFSSFYIGSTLISYESSNILRFLFYDIYAFFPFLIVIASAMLLAKGFIQSHQQDLYIKRGFFVGLLILTSGFVLLFSLSTNIWADLAYATFKAPPHPGYMLFYLGEVFMVVSTVALFAKYLPRFVTNILNVLGRNTLVSYVTHYTFFISVPLAAMFGGGAILEVISLVGICTVCFWGIKKWDQHKIKSKTLKN